MAIFQLEIDDADVDRVLTSVSHNYGWQSLVPNPDYVMQEVVDENGDPVLDENGEPTYAAPVDENGDPLPREIDNPETMGDFTHRIVRQFLAEHVRTYEIQQARSAAIDGLNTDVTIGDPT